MTQDGNRTAHRRDVRATRVRRRRVVGAGVAAVLVLAAVLVAIIVPKLQDDTTVGPTPPPPAPLAAGVVERAHLGSAVELAAHTAPLTSADPAAIASVAKAEQDFTAALLEHVPAGGDANVSVSPASLAIALAMLQNGARARTLGEILTVLGDPSLSPATYDAGWAGLSAQWAEAAKPAGIEFSTANSLWQQRGLALLPDFAGALQRYYASGVWQVDFRSPAALSAMDEWTSQHTHGKITKLFDSLDPSTLLVLANAVYFHATWQTPFEASESKPGPFTTADGSTATATFMTSPNTLPVVTAAGYQATQLPYTGGRFAALAIMPTSGSLTAFVAALDGTKLASIASAVTASAVRKQVQLPRFTTSSKTDLNPVLTAMGITEAFTDQADFSGISTTSLKIGQAIQRVYLQVGEKGTEAAAVTGIGMVPTSTGPVFDGVTFDHPFLFLIRDTQTGAVLFASSIVRPAAS